MGSRSLDLDLLATLLAVARAGSFTAAAKDVRLTQSAVSRQMTDLEQALGTRLFERIGRGVRLTSSGRALVPQAERLLNDVDATRRLIQEMEDGQAGELRIGATVTAANYVLPAILADYRRQHPKVRLVVQPAATQKLLSMLGRGDLDLVVTGRTVDEPGLKTWWTLDDEIVAAAPPAHPLAQGKVVSAHAAAREGWILREAGSDTRRLVDAWSGRRALALHVIMDMW